ncbi:hypothetical protein AB0J55_01520 [Amycolatopsis sp. NPDC049688]|uniref:hypothetical protein n=1 Tax=Amycolatopsis sp. NPDC049688 TaxID=3154733 RepID=UPI0034426297
MLKDDRAGSTLGYRLDGLGVDVVRSPAVAADADRRVVATANGREIGYDAHRRHGRSRPADRRSYGGSLRLEIDDRPHRLAGRLRGGRIRDCVVGRDHLGGADPPGRWRRPPVRGRRPQDGGRRGDRRRRSGA